MCIREEAHIPAAAASPEHKMAIVIVVIDLAATGNEKYCLHQAKYKQTGIRLRVPV